VVTGNIFYSNFWPLSVHHSQNLDNSNAFQFDPDGDTGTATILTNTHQGVLLLFGNLLLEDAAQWNIYNVPYVLDEKLFIAPAGSLTIAANAVIKCIQGTNAGISIDEGGTLNRSTAIFTEYRDDTPAYGGDTNADGTATGAADSSWYGIYDGNDSDSDGTANGFIIDEDYIFYAANE